MRSAVLRVDTPSFTVTINSSIGASSGSRSNFRIAVDTGIQISPAFDPTAASLLPGVASLARMPITSSHTSLTLSSFPIAASYPNSLRRTSCPITATCA